MKELRSTTPNIVCTRFTAASISLLFAIAAGCREAPHIDLREVYDRTDRDFDSAVMFRPDDTAADLPAFVFAPLLIVQNGEAGRPAPDVTFEQTEDGWTYRWRDPVSGKAQGIHATLGSDGFPLAYEVLSDTSGARLLFVDTTLEERAVERFGRALTDRRFSIERSLEDTPAVAVGGIFEPGSTPLGPFVYLWEDTHDVNVVLCRCMPARVFDIVDSIAYTLSPRDPAVETELERSESLDAVLRLP